IMTVLLNIGPIYGEKSSKADWFKAIEYDKKALPYAEAMGDNDALGTITANLGEIYMKLGEDSLALFYLEKSHKAYEGTENLPYTLNLIWQVYARRKEFSKALEFQKNAFNIAGKLDDKLNMTKSLVGMADTYKEKNDIDLAISNYHLAESLAHETDAKVELKKTYEGLTYCYSEKKDFSSAFRYQDLLIGIKDTLYNIEVDKKLGTTVFNYEIDKKQSQISLLTKDKEIQQQEIKRQRLVRNGFIGGFAVVMIFAGVFFMQRNRISKEKKLSDELLLNILPEETAEELKATGTAKAKSFDLVSVLFTDFKNFTQASELLTPEELVEEINLCYCEFDRIVTKYGIEKIKTIGDAYMCAGGLPVSNTTHPVDVINAGLEMVAFIEKNKQERMAREQPFFELRLGIHTGPVVA